MQKGIVLEGGSGGFFTLAAGSLGFSFLTTYDVTMKLLQMALLLITIGYGIHKWRRSRRQAQWEESAHARGAIAEEGEAD